MRPFTYSSADTTTAAIQQAGVADRAAQANGVASQANGVASQANGVASHITAPAQFLAGGTNLLDLMKLDVMRPSHLVDINPLGADPMASRIVANEHGLRIGTAVKMSEAANDPTIKRDIPVLAQTLSLAASSGLRNMASLGGNMLQRTRCAYFRDTSIKQCNKREPGSGCAALDGVNRTHAVLGVSDQCIASYPGDFAQALMALDAVLEIQGPSGNRAIPFAKLHVEPGATPDVETTLKPGELIVAINVPAGGGETLGLRQGARPPILRLRAGERRRGARDGRRHGPARADRARRRRHRAVAREGGRGGPHRPSARRADRDRRRRRGFRRRAHPRTQRL